MIIFTPQKADKIQNPKFFDVTCAIGKNAGLKFLPDITHCDRPWNEMHVRLTSADPDTVMRFNKWEHVDLFKHSDRKKIIILDQFQPHHHLRKHTGEKVYKLNPNQYYPRPQPGIDYSWADLIICIQEEMIHGSEWVEFLNNQDEYFGTSPGRVISIVTGAIDHIGHNVFPYNALRVPLNLWGAWTAASNTAVKYDPALDRPYKFEALLGGVKEHRKFLFDLLQRNQLLDHGLVSISAQTYVSSPNQKYHDMYYRTPELDHYDNPEMVAVRNKTRYGGWVAHSTHSLGLENFSIGNGKTVPQVMPYGSFFIPHGVYQNSWFSIIAETVGSGCDFFTEKTAKVLFGKRIFVTFGPRHSLRAIKAAGFKTFDGWIDESYDDEPDDIKRWTQAFEQVVKLINHPNPRELYCHVDSILEHNYQRIANPKAMLAPVNNFIQSFLNGTAQPDPAWTPIPETHDYARLRHEMEQSQHLDLLEYAMHSFPVDQLPTSNPMQDSSGHLLDHPLTSNPMQDSGIHLFDQLPISDALEQARANTRARRTTQVSNQLSTNDRHRFNRPEILHALKQARATTQARRAAQVI